MWSTGSVCSTASRVRRCCRSRTYGGRFWVYQVVDQRTDSYVELGAMYGTAPGHYLLAPVGWDGEIPDGIAGMFRFDTRISVCIPRVFMDDTDEDRVAIQPLINQVMIYPPSQFTGEMQTMDWNKAPVFHGGDATSGEQESQWVDPTTFFDLLPTVIDEVPARPGEEALYDGLRSLLHAAAADPRGRGRDPRRGGDDPNRPSWPTCSSSATSGSQSRATGAPRTTGAAFGTDYLSRTAMARANIFVNTPAETTYFYQDLDASGEHLDGSNTYTVTFPTGALPPIRSFWSLTLYNQHHFFHANDLGRYPLGTKNKTLVYGEDGSLTISASAAQPDHEKQLANWLPAREDPFSLYLRAYWPEEAIRNGTWTPAAVQRAT